MPNSRSRSHGPMFDSWSAVQTMISSPGENWLRIAVASHCSSTVALGPKTISSGRAALTSVCPARRPAISASAAAWLTA